MDMTLFIDCETFLVKEIFLFMQHFLLMEPFPVKDCSCFLCNMIPMEKLVQFPCYFQGTVISETLNFRSVLAGLSLNILQISLARKVSVSTSLQISGLKKSHLNIFCFLNPTGLLKMCYPD